MPLDPRWTATIDKAIKDDAWDGYDELVRKEVDSYNLRFGNTLGYKVVDWHILKAVLWVESGGPGTHAWTHRAMQIGNPGDRGYAVLKGRHEGSSVIMTTHLAAEIKTRKIDDPKLNIRAGIAYLFTRMAYFDEKSVLDAQEVADRAYVVIHGDSLQKIAHKVGTTVELLETLNPNTEVLHPKQILKYRRASRKLVITGWRDFTSVNIWHRYNTGDPNYAAKLNYAMVIIFSPARLIKEVTQ